MTRSSPAPTRGAIVRRVARRATELVEPPCINRLLSVQLGKPREVLEVGSVELSIVRPSETEDSVETPDQALSRARKKVREARHRQAWVVLGSRPSRSATV